MKSDRTAGLPDDAAVLACRVFEPELSSLGVPPHRVVYLDQGLHRFPDLLRRELTSAVKAFEQESAVHRVIVLYGYCGGGLEGLSAQRVELVLPLAHDCVPLLLGREIAAAEKGPGATFYLSAGWIDHGLTPYTEYFATRDKFGAEDALWVGQQMLAGYHEVALVDTGACLRPHHRRYAQEMASLFGLSYREVPGCQNGLRILLTGVIGPRVMVMPPGRAVERALYPS